MPSQVQIILQQVNDELESVGLLLTENPHLELGSQPEVINDLLSSLIHTQNSLTSTFNNIFTIERDVVTANDYLKLVASFDEAIFFIQEVKATRYGSLENTSKAFGLIEKCHNHFLILIGHCNFTVLDEQLNSKEAAILPTQEKLVLQPDQAAQQISRVSLFKLLMSHFSQEELEELSFYLNVTYDDLSGDNRKKKARELIGYLERSNQIQDLVDLIQELRPQISIE
ncbi:MAG: hypothetical protein H6658_12345 [Ardenticatenaceae bacterium]|nr:hypothetical protein [Ardenticatenaceae bacterium]